MRKIAHISDIHFGRTDAAVLIALRESINELAPDLLVVSGDLTQRAKRSEFRDAKAYLDQFQLPKVIVPGNHDVPLYNVIDRFIRPLEKWDEFFGGIENTFFVDDKIAAIGINTARSMTIKSGRINSRQLRSIAEKIGTLDDSYLKIIVSHHPFDAPAEIDDADIVGRAEEAMPIIARSGADVFLAGHLHVSSITNSAHRYKLPDGRSALIIQAGTAASTRGRGEPNSFNLLHWDGALLEVIRYECGGGANAAFTPANSERFTQADLGWSRLSEA